jgi:glycosyltransferase involved in cell wall biosynthesis
VAALFDFKNADALAETVNQLLDDDALLNELKENAYEYGLHLRWPVTGLGIYQSSAGSCRHARF